MDHRGEKNGLQQAACGKEYWQTPDRMSTVTAHQGRKVTGIFKNNFDFPTKLKRQKKNLSTTVVLGGKTSPLTSQTKKMACQTNRPPQNLKDIYICVCVYTLYRYIHTKHWLYNVVKHVKILLLVQQPSHTQLKSTPHLFSFILQAHPRAKNELVVRHAALLATLPKLQQTMSKCHRLDYNTVL